MKKRKDEKKRLRNKTIGFRVSPEEWEQFEKVVKVSGLSKQEYLISKLYERDIKVYANPRMYKALKGEIANILEELKRLNSINADDELLDIITVIANILADLKDENKSSYPAR